MYLNIAPRWSGLVLSARGRLCLEVLLLLGWCLFLFLYGAGSGTLYRTEALRAIIAQAALDGRWFVPTLYGEPFLTKPPGMYIAIGLCSLPFGQVTEWSARLPSVLAGTVTVFAFFATFRRLLGPATAFPAALLLPLSFLWLDKAPSAEIDMLLVCWVSLAMLALLRVVEMEEDPARYSAKRRAMMWLVAWICMTAGFLTKWTAPAFFYLAFVPFLWLRGRISLLWSGRHFLAISASIAIIGTWVVFVAAQVGLQVLVDTFLREAAQRFHPHYRGKPYPWGESVAYPFVVMAANLPWTVLAVWNLWRKRPIEQLSLRRLTQLCHCWFWPNLLFWSLPAQHAVRYSMPIGPAMSTLGLLTVMSFSKVQRERIVLGLMLAWIATKIIYTEYIVPKRSAERNVTITAERLSALVPQGELLYLCKLKDEGVLFYYARPAIRFTPQVLPSRPFYAVLLPQEWATRDQFGRVELIQWLRDQQGAPFALVRIEEP